MLYILLQQPNKKLTGCSDAYLENTALYKIIMCCSKKKKKSQFHTSLKLLREAPLSPKTQK